MHGPVLVRGAPPAAFLPDRLLRNAAAEELVLLPVIETPAAESRECVGICQKLQAPLRTVGIPGIVENLVKVVIGCIVEQAFRNPFHRFLFQADDQICDANVEQHPRIFFAYEFSRAFCSLAVREKRASFSVIYCTRFVKRTSFVPPT